MPVGIRWQNEEVPRPGRSGTYVRRVAWIVAEDPDAEAVRYLAYLGANPQITKELQFEFDALYPDLQVDWDVLSEKVEKPPTRVQDLSYDELAIRLRSILGEHGHDMDAVDTDFGGVRHRPLKELERLLSSPEVTARFERTSGSVFRYMCEAHPDYAYAVLKVRLLLESRTSELKELVDGEAQFGKSGRALERRDYYVRALQYHVSGS